MADSAPAPSSAPATAAETAPPSASAPTRPARSRRTLLFGVLGIVVVVLGLVSLLYWATIGRNHVTTDDAYVNTDSAEITPQVAGQVAAVPVTDTEPVKRGQLLVQIDPADARVALDQAQAQLDQAVR